MIVVILISYSDNKSDSVNNSRARHQWRINNSSPPALLSFWPHRPIENIIIIIIIIIPIIIIIIIIIPIIIYLQEHKQLRPRSCIHFS